jgi:hypothetical protein
MKKFKAHGFWYLPEEPEKKVVGTLRKNRDGIRVLLFEGFSNSWGNFDPEEYRTLFGIIDEHPHGRFVTLVNCKEIRHSLGMPGFAMQELLAEIAYLGEAYLADSDRKFIGIQLRVAHFDEWFDCYNFKTKLLEPASAGGMTVTFRRPEGIEFSVRDKRLRISSAFSGGGGFRSVTLQDMPYFIIDDLEATDLETISQTYVGALRNFISLATDAPCPIADLILLHSSLKRRDESPAPFAVVRQQVMNPSRRSTKISKTDMLFTYTDVVKTGTNFFDNWFTFNERYGEFCATYFNHMLAPLRYSEENFVRTLAELQLFFRSSEQVQPEAVTARKALENLHLDKVLDYSDQWSAYSLPDEYDLGFPRNLCSALGEYADLMTPLIGADHKQFIDSVMATKLFISRRDARLSPLAAQDTAMYYLIQKLRFLLRICILDKAGFPRDWIREIVTHHRVYLYLKASSA